MYPRLRRALAERYGFVLLTNKVSGHAADSLICNQLLRPFSHCRSPDVIPAGGYF
jgi:hypothetical protein